MSVPIISRIEYTDGRDSQVRMHLSFPETLEIENGTPLGEVYRHWLTCNVDDPGMFFESRRYLSKEAQSTISTIVDVSADEPLEYLFREHTLRTSFHFYAGLRIGELRSRMAQKALTDEYLYVKGKQEPVIHEVHEWRTTENNTRVDRHYVKINLPLFDQTGAVSYIVVASRFLAPDIVPLSCALEQSLLVR
jgi:hypothetical protein